MDLATYTQWRLEHGIGSRGIENLSRRPGVITASSKDSGFPDWSDRSANRMVFHGQLGR
jgi:hypothetical protein